MTNCSNKSNEYITKRLKKCQLFLKNNDLETNYNTVSNVCLFNYKYNYYTNLYFYCNL